MSSTAGRSSEGEIAAWGLFCRAIEDVERFGLMNETEYPPIVYEMETDNIRHERICSLNFFWHSLTIPVLIL